LVAALEHRADARGIGILSRQKTRVWPFRFLQEACELNDTASWLRRQRCYGRWSCCPAQQPQHDQPERVVDEELGDRADDDRDQVGGEQDLAAELVGQPSVGERAEEDADQGRGAKTWSCDWRGAGGGQAWSVPAVSSLSCIVRSGDNRYLQRSSRGTRRIGPQFPLPGAVDSAPNMACVNRR